MPRIAKTENGEAVFITDTVPLPVTSPTLEILLGNDANIKPLSVDGLNADVGTSFEDVSPVGGTQTLPTGVETWEVVSSSASDTDSVRINTLGADYAEQSDTTTLLNGTTPVTLTGTHFRARRAIIVGPDEGTNVGAITFRVSGGGAERLTIPAGEGISKTSLFSVPATKTAFGLRETLSVEKNQDAVIKAQASIDGGAVVTGAPIAIYQSPESIPFTSPVVLPQKTDWRILAKSTNTGTEVTVFLDFFLVDNSILSNVPEELANLI